MPFQFKLTLAACRREINNKSHCAVLEKDVGQIVFLHATECMSWMEIVNSSAASKSDESPSGCVSARSLTHSHSDLLDYPPCSWAWQMRWAAPTSFLWAGATLCGFGRAKAEGHAEGRSLAVPGRWFIALRQSLTASRSSAARPGSFIIEVGDYGE